MSTEDRSLSPAEAAKKLGVSTKALRLYEQRSLITPARTETGWRCYRSADMKAAAEVVALRKLGLSLAQIAQVKNGDLSSFDAALTVHEQDLERRIEELQRTAAKVRALRGQTDRNGVEGLCELSSFVSPEPEIVASFELPWPWGGETFDVRRPQRLNFIIGPLASGKTRFAKRLAAELPGARFLGLDRLAEGAVDAKAKLGLDANLNERVNAGVRWLVDEGAEPSEALIALLVGLESATQGVFVVDLIEQSLSASTQEAIGAYIRRPTAVPRTLFVMTRSTAILDLDCIGSDESIILCPPNQDPPMYVTPLKGTPGYETVRLCLAAPNVRQRMDGVVAIHREPAMICE